MLILKNLRPKVKTTSSVPPSLSSSPRFFPPPPFFFEKRFRGENVSSFFRDRFPSNFIYFRNRSCSAKIISLNSLRRLLLRSRFYTSPFPSFPFSSFLTKRCNPFVSPTRLDLRRFSQVVKRSPRRQTRRPRRPRPFSPNLNLRSRKRPDGASLRRRKFFSTVLGSRRSTISRGVLKVRTTFLPKTSFSPTNAAPAIS